MDVYEMDVENFESEMIYQNDDGYSFGGISNDKKYMALTKPINTNDAEMFLYNMNSKEYTKISENQAGYSPEDFSVDSKYLYYQTDDGSEFSYLMKYDIETSGREKVMQADWDVAYAYFSHNGKYRVIGINEDAKNSISILNTETGKDVEFPKLDGVDITSIGISRSEKLMAFYAGSSRTTSNLYVFEF